MFRKIDDSSLDSYQNAMDALDPGDVAMFTTPCAFRWLHFKYARTWTKCFYGETGHRRWVFFKENAELNEQAKKLNLKIGIGLMCRHSQARRELKSRIEDGELADNQHESLSDAGPNRVLFFR